MINSNGTQSGDNKKTRNPILDASLLSKFLFLWQRKLFSIGLNRPIEEEDIYATLDNHRSCRIGGQFDKLWKRETIRSPHNPSFLKVIIRLFGLRVLGFGLLYTTLDVICRFVLLLPSFQHFEFSSHSIQFPIKSSESSSHCVLVVWSCTSVQVRRTQRRRRLITLPESSCYACSCL